MWVIAPVRKRKMKTPMMGPSSPGVGVSPRPAMVGGYGLCLVIAYVNEFIPHSVVKEDREPTASEDILIKLFTVPIRCPATNS